MYYNNTSNYDDYLCYMLLIIFILYIYLLPSCFCRPKMLCPKMVSERYALLLLSLLLPICYIILFYFWSVANNCAAGLLSTRLLPSPPRWRSYIIIIYRGRPIGRTVHDMVRVCVCVCILCVCILLWRAFCYRFRATNPVFGTRSVSENIAIARAKCVCVCV